MRFYLGTHRRTWLARLDFGLCVSRQHFLTRRGIVGDDLPQALAPWLLDSGAFTEVSTHGRWTTDTPTFVAQCRSIADQVGRVAYIGPQDWMCEPEIIAKTGLSVPEHQRRTVANFLDLRTLAPDLPFIPALQGYEPDDYLRCIDASTAAGIDLTSEPLVGLGSVCRRSHLRPIAALVSDLSTSGIRLHGFGMKVQGLRRFGWALASSDSSSWSLDGRLPKGSRCGTHDGSCANCIVHAVAWRSRLLRSIQTQQPAVWAL